MNAAVFDTNVLVSGLLSPHGPPGLLVEALQEGLCQAVLDDRVWDEYVEVLGRPNLGFPPADVDLFLTRIREQAIQASPMLAQGHAAALPDPTDAPFLECATALGVPLVTGNAKHFPRSAAGDVEILSPAVYVRRLRAAART